MKQSDINARNQSMNLTKIIKDSKSIPNIKKSHHFSVSNTVVKGKTVPKITTSLITP
jgi:hypothetical protein